MNILRIESATFLPVVRVKSVFPFRLLPGSYGIIELDEVAQIDCPLPHYHLRSPLIPAVVARHPDDAAGVGARARLVLAVFRRGNRAEIGEPVVRSHAVDMVDEKRVFARDHFPNDAVEQEGTTLDTNGEVAAAVSGPGDVPDMVPIVFGNATDEQSCVRVVDEKLEKDRPLGQFADSHADLSVIVVVRAGPAFAALSRPALFIT